MSGFVYAILALDRVKIGFTSGDPRLRLKTLQTGSPVELSLVGWSHGSLQVEAGVHADLAQYRERGEWFRYEGPVVDFVSQMARPTELAKHAKPKRVDDGRARARTDSGDPATELGSAGVLDGGAVRDRGRGGSETLSPAERSRRWRKANAEKHRAYQREWMRRMRQK